MSRLVRALIFCLAVLPAVWGTCPGWITGTCCCVQAGGKAANACCPLCAEREQQSGRKAPCTHCPCQMARDGSAPAPDAVEAPAADLSVSVVAVLADAGPVVAALAHASAVEPRPPGWPRDAAPNRVGTVVLVV
jgi:hypothetical protein